MRRQPDGFTVNSGHKYRRRIHSVNEDGSSVEVDVYCVLEAFAVRRHAVGHAVKKLLCCGQRGGKDEIQDLEEAIDAIRRAIQDATRDKELEGRP